MAECRYFPECQRCNETGDSWLPCDGGADGTRCEGYEPMPDVDALLKLADKMQSQQYMREDARMLRWDEAARRIRECIGR